MGRVRGGVARLQGSGTRTGVGGRASAEPPRKPPQIRIEYEYVRHAIVGSAPAPNSAAIALWPVARLSSMST